VAQHFANSQCKAALADTPRRAPIAYDFSSNRHPALLFCLSMDLFGKTGIPFPEHAQFSESESRVLRSRSESVKRRIDEEFHVPPPPTPPFSLLCGLCLREKYSRQHGGLRWSSKSSQRGQPIESRIPCRDCLVRRLSQTPANTRENDGYHRGAHHGFPLCLGGTRPDQLHSWAG